VLPREIGENLLEVHVSIDARYEQRLRRDSLARSQTLGLLGDKYLELTSGSPASDLVPEGGEMAAAPPTHVEQLAEAGEDVMNNIVTISHQMTGILGRMERGEGLLGELTVDADPDRKLGREILDTLAAIRAAIERLETGTGTVPRLMHDAQMADRIQSAVTRLDGLLGRAETGDGLLPALLDDAAQKESFARTLTHLESVTGQLAAVLTRLEQGDALAGRLLHDEAWGEQVSADLAALVANLRQVAEKLNRGDGTAARLLNDPAFAEALEDILVGIDE